MSGFNDLFKYNYIQQPISRLTEENIDRLEQHCERTIRTATGRLLEEHQVILELIGRYKEMCIELKQKKEIIRHLEIDNSQLKADMKTNYINKAQIEKTIEMLENQSGGNSYHVQAMINAQKNILKELLKEE